MKLNHLLVTDYLKKILITIISLSVFLTPALAFASDVSDQEQAPLEVESVPDPWLSLETKTMELRAVDKTLTDVYNIINSGLMSGSTPKLDNIYSNISSNLEFWADNTRYSIADLQGMTWGLANSINNKLSSTNSILGNIYNENYTTNRKLEYVFSAIEDTINIKWYNAGFSYDSTSLSLGGSPLTSQTSANKFFVTWHATSDYYPNTPCILRLFIPINRHSSLLTTSDIFTIEQLYAQTYLAQIPDYFTQLTSGGFYIYLFDFKPYTSNTFTFVISSPVSITFNPNLAPNSYLIPFDTLDYQIIKTAFYQAKSSDSDKKSLDQLVQISAQLSSLAQSSQSGSEAAEALADYIVSPQKQAAEDASQQVINNTLDNFTGSGGAAAKKADTSSMKDISVQVKSGINGGGSTSNATDVLNPSSVSGQTFWIWFSTTTKNNVENPYPAPVVNNTRKGSDGDEIIDTLSGYQEQLKNLLGGDSK